MPIHKESTKWTSSDLVIFPGERPSLSVLCLKNLLSDYHAFSTNVFTYPAASPQIIVKLHLVAHAHQTICTFMVSSSIYDNFMRNSSFRGLLIYCYCCLFIYLPAQGCVSLCSPCWSGICQSGICTPGELSIPLLHYPKC